MAQRSLLCLGHSHRLNCSITVVVQGAIQYNKIVSTIEYYKSKVVKLYYLIRATPELTRQDVRIFYGTSSSFVTPSGMAAVFDPP